MIDRIVVIRERLTQAFSPVSLEVIDDSEQHRGHAGAQGGAGHYTVIISCEKFREISRVQAHRMVYEALQDLMPHEIHALRIKITPSDLPL